MKERRITNQMLMKFDAKLHNDEKSKMTIEKYLRDVKFFISFLSGKLIEKSIVLAYKAQLEKKG